MYFKDLLRYRQAWIGVALLWIIIFHLPLDFSALSYLKSCGYGGVDICFFASGIGCFYSLTTESDIGNFIKRRLKRLMPAYLIFIVIWLIFKFTSGEFNFQMAVGNILALQHFSGHIHAFNWYIGAILLFYLFAPYFKILIDRSTSICKFFFLAFLLACSIPFWEVGVHLITVSRFPIFYIGMLFAEVCQKDTLILKKHIISAILMFIAGILSLCFSFIYAPQFLESHALAWYPFIMITPPLCIGISFLLHFIEKAKISKPVISFLELCGNYSFELYLIHLLLIPLISLFIEKYNLSNFRYLVWAAGIIPLSVGCFILRRVTLYFHRLYCTVLRRQFNNQL